MLALPIHDIRQLYLSNIDLVRRPDAPSQPTVLELEAKFGYYSGKTFRSNVPYVHFERLLTLLRARGKGETVQESQVAQSERIRRVTTTSMGNAPETIIWQRKQRLRDFDLTSYDIRVSVNREETLTPDQIPADFKPSVIRERTRHSFIMENGLIQVDMTEVMMSGEDRIARARYEVEVEFLGEEKDLPLFEEHIAIIFRLLRGTNLIYDNVTKDKLIRETVKILGQTRGDMIDKDVLVEARNIKRRDLVWGGIVGNRDTSYMVTYKADGLRKMLIIHSSGIWLVYPPFEFNLVLDPSLNISQLGILLTKFNGTIFDGELVVPKNPKPLKYLYLAFDCLAFSGNAGIQGQPYSERQKVVNAISGAVRTPLLTIDTKRTEEIKTAEQFFTLVTDFLSKRETLDYNEDGLIFIPASIRYNPHSEKLELRDRGLTRVPDVCKWKQARNVTIDFSLKWIDAPGSELGRMLELYSYDERRKEMVPFRGDVINPLTPDMIDHTNAMTLDKPTNLVVEYEWMESMRILRPRRIRLDKMGPNRLSIALDDWEDVHNPISQADIQGDTLMMTTSYHNRIKRGLYNIIPRGSNILDIGSGQGGDVAKWLGLARKNRGEVGRNRGEVEPNTGLVVAVEPNANNRTELIARIGTFDMGNRVMIVPGGGEDVATITEAVRQFIPGGKVDAVTLMLSMSFFWASDYHLEALITTIVTNLKPGGMIVFLTVNGTTLEQIFEPALGGIAPVSDKRIATADIHLYPRPVTPVIPRENGQDEQNRPLFGRPLDFVLPDTIVGDQREYLVHIHDFTRRLATYGINLRENHRAEGERLLSPGNALFSSMYSYGYYVNDDKILLEQMTKSLPIQMNPVLPSPPNPVETPPVISYPEPLAEEAVVIPLPTIPQIKSLAPVVASRALMKERMQLPALGVRYTGRGGKIVSGRAINDDTYAPLTCSWYDDLVRIATIGDGSCFIHAVLKAFYKPYQDNDDASYRLDVASVVRRDLAICLGMDNPDYPGHTYWETAGRGSFPRMVMQQISDEDLVGDLRVDYSLTGLQRLFNSYNQLGDEVYTFVSDILNVDIYVLRATKDDLYPHLHTRRANVPRNGIVIIGNLVHYEVLAVDGEDELFQTVFAPDDPFLEALTGVFIGDPNFQDIMNVIPYDPDESFINDAVEAFSTNNVLNIPDKIADIFLEDDPFRIQLSRLRTSIEQAARRRLITFHPVIQELERIIPVMRQAGFDADMTQRVRDVVEHRVDPDIPQHLDSIIAAAETDGLLDRETVNAIMAVKASL